MRVTALIKRIFQQMLRDKRTLALLFLAPLLVLTLMYVLFHSEDVAPALGVAGGNGKLIEVLEKTDIEVREYPEAAQAEEALQAEAVEGFLNLQVNPPVLVLLQDDPSRSKALQMKVQQVLAAQSQQQLAARLPQGTAAAAPQLDVSYVYGSADTSFFDILSPVLVGFFVFFFVFLISGIGLLRERTTGTLERLMATPVRRGEIVVGYLIGYGLFAVMQTVIVVLYAVHILHMTVAGSIWHVILINLMLALVALSLGILLSSFAASEFQMMQFIPIVVIPQVFFTGIFPLEGMPHWLQTIAKLMPMYHGANALKDVMYKGGGLGDISGTLLVLGVFAGVFILLNVAALRKYRTL